MRNRFVFVSPMYNASTTLRQMLVSLLGQTYGDWRLILIDDVSNLDEVHACNDIVSSLRDDRVFVQHNTTKKWETENVLLGVSQCRDTDIVCRIDADDYLCDLDALSFIDEAYEKTLCEVLWTAHRWNFTNTNISGPLPDRADPYAHPWVSSHLKTFRKALINGVNDENFRGQDGSYIKRAGDQALYLPILRKARKRVYLPIVAYHYNIKYERLDVRDTMFQKSEADFLRERGFIE